MTDINNLCRNMNELDSFFVLCLLISAEKYARLDERRFVEEQDIKKAFSEMRIERDSIELKYVKNIIKNRVEYLKNDFEYRSAWDASMLIIGLLSAGEDPNSEKIRNIRDWLLNDRNRTDNGLWHNPDLKHPNVFDTSFAVLALLQLGFKEENQIIDESKKFLIQSFDPCGGWQSIPRIGEIDVGATSWAIIALTKAGISISHPCIDRGVNWLIYNQREDGGWGYLCKKHSSKSYVTRTYDAITALSEVEKLLNSNELNNKINYVKNNTKNYLIQQHELWSEGGEGKWKLAWKGYKYEDIIVSAEENTITAVLALIMLGIKWNSAIIQAGIKTILEMENNIERDPIHRDSIRAILCLSKFLNIASEKPETRI